MRKLELTDKRVAIIAYDFDDFMDYLTPKGKLRKISLGWYSIDEIENVVFAKVSSITDTCGLRYNSFEETEKSKELSDYQEIKNSVLACIVSYNMSDIQKTLQWNLDRILEEQKSLDEKLNKLEVEANSYGLTFDGWTVCSNDEIYVLHGYYESRTGAKTVDDFQMNIQVDCKVYRYLRKLALDGWDELDFYEKEFFYQQGDFLCTIYPIDDDASLTDILLKTIWTLDGDTIVIDSSNVRNSMDNTEDTCQLKISSMSIYTYNKLKQKQRK